MAEATKPAQAATLGQARIAGRIDAVRSKSTQQGKMFLTLLKLPAADAYSSPSTVEVRSGERLGGNGEEISILVRIGGYPRSYKPDGEDTPVRTAENSLQFVGHA